MNVFKEYGVDETRGDLFKQAARSATGYPDPYELGALRVESAADRPTALRDEARKKLSEIALTYGNVNVGKAIQSLLPQEHLENE